MIEQGSTAFWRATLALCLGSFMIFANVYTTQPLLPILRHELAISSLQANWTLAVTTLMLGAALLIFGPLSDAFGRRKLMRLSMAGVVLTTLALSQVDDYRSLLVLRGLQGFFLGGLPAIAVAYMGDEFSRKALMVAVGLYISGNTLGGLGGRLISGFMAEHFSWQASFLASGILSAVILLVFWWLLPASQHFEARSAHPVRMARDLLGHLRNPVLILAYLIGGFNFFVFINQYSYITYRLSDAPFNLSVGFLSLLFLTYLSGTYGSAISGRFAQRWPQPLCMAIGIVILMIGSMVTLIPWIPAILAGLLINAFGFFFCHSNASSWVSRNALQARAGASALYLVFYYLGASLGGFYLDVFWHWSRWSGVVEGSLVILVGTLALSLYLWRLTRQQERPGMASEGALKTGASS
ncbi:MFS transporter [Terasakiispira papahanaumokuakeensis]|uniref:MFS transporter n=1 Tax=Terasakiispira papahanaumokuakeensis TaxID=197479 RepID=A0A1E2V791_9GAMM|nr:MFS transporter [Terasakiispira papahanaumokuakeensis]ODC02844.1 MFS transporter [Terasakiispira papahanaumokuakeensis]